jgi:cyclic pyranopterin monophosphate synthase
MNQELTHLDATGAANMVDVGSKEPTKRTAKAIGRIRTRPDVVQLMLDSGLKKGDVFAVARVAGIMAAKKTADLIPLCHTLLLSKVSVDFEFNQPLGYVYVKSYVALTGQTGVEMEALAAVSVAALTVYDMCKAVDAGMIIDSLQLVEKTGGKNGYWKRESASLEEETIL